MYYKMISAFLGLLLLCFLYLPVNAQNKLPIIRAMSSLVDVRDGNDFRKAYWSISPEIKPDVFYADRDKRTKKVTFYTDVDSITFTVEPNRTYDFAILLNGKDTAFTQISTHLPPPLPMRSTCNGCSAAADTFPFTFGKGNKVYLKATINNSAPLDLMFDLGSNQVVISKKGLAKGVRMQFDGTKDNASFGGHNTVRTSERNTLKIGTLVWDSVSVVGIDNADGDGIIGYNVFDGRIIEMDYDKKRLIVHEAGFAAGASYQPMALRFKGGLPFIEATLVNGNKEYKDYFEFDGGSNGSLWLNQAFAARHNLYATLKTIGETTSRGLGGSTRNQTVLMPKILIGRYELTGVPIDLELPSSQPHLTWGIFGMDVLKRFNVVIDFAKDSLYIKPNGLMNEPYRKPFNKNLLFVALGVLVVVLLVFLLNRRKKENKKQLSKTKADSMQ